MQLLTMKIALSVHMAGGGRMSTPCNISSCRDAQISPDNGSDKDFHWQVSITASGKLKPKRTTEPRAAQKGNRDGFTGQHESLVLAKGIGQRSGTESPATHPAFASW